MVHPNWEFLPRTCKHLSPLRIVAICCHFNLQSYSQHTGDYWKLLEITGDYEKLLEIIYRLLETTRDYQRLIPSENYSEWAGDRVQTSPLFPTLSHFPISSTPLTPHLFLTHLCHNLHDNFSHNHMLSIIDSRLLPSLPTLHSCSTLSLALQLFLSPSLIHFSPFSPPPLIHLPSPLHLWPYLLHALPSLCKMMHISIWKY